MNTLYLINALHLHKLQFSIGITEHAFGDVVDLQTFQISSVEKKLVAKLPSLISQFAEQGSN